jgi:hypothetical protein
VGPAIGGIVLAATSAGTVFLINAVTFVAVIAWWRGGKPSSHVLPREHVGEAIRAGARYVTASPALRVILLRAGLFAFFASSICALLPLIAGTAAPRFGRLRAAAGVRRGRRCHRRRPAAAPARPVDARSPAEVASLGLAAVAIILGYVPLTAPVAVALAVGGLAWILRCRS